MWCRAGLGDQYQGSLYAEQVGCFSNTAPFLLLDVLIILDVLFADLKTMWLIWVYVAPTVGARLVFVARTLNCVRMSHPRVRTGHPFA